jgi:CBS domain-containing protein
VLVRDLMHRDLVTCSPGAPLGQVARRLLESKVHAVIVAEPGGAPLGVLTDFDLLAGEWLSTDPERLQEMRSVTAGELMTAPAVSIDGATDAGEAARVMGRERIARLVVVDEDRAVGVISVSDIVRKLTALPRARATVGNVMSRAFLVCRPDAPVPDIARGLSERNSRSVVVLGRGGGAVGVITRQDLVTLTADDAQQLTASDVMNEPITTTSGTSLSEAIDEMIRSEVHRLLVVDPDAPGEPPVGLLSSWDVVAEMAAPGSPWLGAAR